MSTAHRVACSTRPVGLPEQVAVVWLCGETFLKEREQLGGGLGEPGAVCGELVAGVGVVLVAGSSVCSLDDAVGGEPS